MARETSVRPGGGIRPRTSRWASPDIAALQRRILIDAGQPAAAALVPDVPVRFLPLAEVRTLLGLSTSSIYRGIAAGKIPRPISLDGLLVPDQPCGPEAPRRRVRAPAATKGRPPNPRRTARDTTPQTA